MIGRIIHGIGRPELQQSGMTRLTVERIDVCICTYRRSSLRETLSSVAAQRLPQGITVRVVVADNDLMPSREEDIRAHAQALGLDLQYVHAPSRNISIARNACLDAATSDWIAFIDDDEEAASDWIEKLVAAREGRQVVFGVSQARYPDEGCAQWIIDGDFHSNRLQGNDAAWNGYTANVLIDRLWITQHHLRFALELGQVGGEDTMFFYQCHLAGCRFSYAPLAVVHEDTPESRASLGWLLRRRYRSGQIHYMILQIQGRGRVPVLLTGAAKSLYSLMSAGLAAFNPVRRSESLLRGALHVGVVAAALGASPYLEYGGDRSD
jgi:succinoglycan biosynthesis protein ExoM